MNPIIPISIEHVRLIEESDVEVSPPPPTPAWDLEYKAWPILTYRIRKSFIKKGQIPDARSAILIDDLKLHLVKIM